jgi:twitching motility protein PilT
LLGNLTQKEGAPTPPLRPAESKFAPLPPRADLLHPGATLNLPPIGDCADLTELPFTDIYIAISVPQGEDFPAAMFAPEMVGHNEPNTRKVPSNLEDDVATLRKLLERQRELRPNHDDDPPGKPRWYNGMVTYHGMRLRYALAMSTRGQLWAAVRRIPATIPLLATDLGLNENAIPLLATLGRERSGMVLVAGQTSAGKTTTTVSMLKHFMEAEGKRLFAIEDPCEYLLHGAHGEGFCFQNEADDNGGWFESIKTALRSHPDYIFLGEIRDSVVAQETIRAAMTGHLVFSTIHAGSLSDALDSIIRLSGASASESIREQIGQQIKMIIYQTRKNGAVSLDILDCREKDTGENIRQLLKRNQTNALDKNWSKNYPARL